MSIPVVAGGSCPRMQALAIAMLHVMHKGYCGYYAILANARQSRFQIGQLSGAYVLLGKAGRTRA